MVWQPVAPSAAPISIAAISPSGVSLRPLAVFGLLFRSQPHIEHGAENRIACAATGTSPLFACGEWVEPLQNPSRCAPHRWAVDMFRFEAGQVFAWLANM